MSGMWAASAHIVPDISLSSTSESLNGEGFAFFHLCLVSTLDNRYAFGSMNLVMLDAVAVEITYAFDRVSLPVKLNFVAFHGLLDSCTNIAHSDVNTGFLLLCQDICHHQKNPRLTRMPVFVPSLTASNSLSYLGSNATVHALSTILPLMWTPKSIFITSPCCRIVLFPALGE